MRNKMLSCLRYNLKKLLASPVTYLVIVLTILFVDREILPVRNYLRDSGDLISWEDPEYALPLETDERLRQ